MSLEANNKNPRNITEVVVKKKGNHQLSPDHMKGGFFNNNGKGGPGAGAADAVLSPEFERALKMR